MAHTLSTKKRVRQNVKLAAQNRGYKSRIRTAKKQLLESIASGKSTVQEQLRTTVALIQRTAGKGVIHKNKAANLISELSLRANAARSK